MKMKITYQDFGFYTITAILVGMIIGVLLANFK